MSEIDFASAARMSLSAYAPILLPKYKVADHHALIAYKLRQVAMGKIKRLMIFAPPRHGKSELATQIFPSWYFGHFPKNSLIEVAYGQDIADDFGRQVTSYMQTDIYKQLWPIESHLSPKSESIKRFQTNAGGNFYAVGKGAAVTGRGGNGIIIDDPYKGRKEADSQTYNDELWSYYKGTLYTRLMSTEDGVDGWIIVIQTRWNAKDLVYKLIQQQFDDPTLPQWEILNLVALTETDEDVANDPLHRDFGQALWPERYSASTLLNIKGVIGSREWQSQYKQKPLDSEGAIIKKEWIRYYCEDNCDGRSHDSTECFFLPVEKIKHGQTWDFSYAKTSDSDYFVGYSWVRQGANMFFTDRTKNRGNLPDCEKAFREFNKKHPELGRKYIEAKANGQAVIDKFKSDISGIVPVYPERVGEKKARWNVAAPSFESGNIFFPRHAVWVQDAVDWITAVPDGEYDDDADAVCQAVIKELTNKMTSRGGFEYFKQLAEQRGIVDGAPN